MTGPIDERFAARLLACWRQKVAVCLGLAVGICVPYFTLQRWHLGDPVVVPATPVDDWIGFQPAWTVVYLSIAGLVPLAVWMQPDRDALVRYAWGLATLCVPSFVVFAVLPVAGPRPEIGPESGLYGFLVGADRPTNSLPSLHAGLTVYSLLVIDRVRRRAGAAAWRAAEWIWALAILYATVATKQHWVIDLIPGVALAWAAARLSWRGRRAPAATGDA